MILNLTDTRASGWESYIHSFKLNMDLRSGKSETDFCEKYGHRSECLRSCLDNLKIKGYEILN